MAGAPRWRACRSHPEAAARRRHRGSTRTDQLQPMQSGLGQTAAHFPISATTRARPKSERIAPDVFLPMGGQPAAGERSSDCARSGETHRHDPQRRHRPLVTVHRRRDTAGGGGALDRPARPEGPARCAWRPVASAATKLERVMEEVPNKSPSRTTSWARRGASRCRSPARRPSSPCPSTMRGVRILRPSMGGSPSALHSQEAGRTPACPAACRGEAFCLTLARRMDVRAPAVTTETGRRAHLSALNVLPISRPLPMSAGAGAACTGRTTARRSRRPPSGQSARSALHRDRRTHVLRGAVSRVTRRHLPRQPTSSAPARHGDAWSNASSPAATYRRPRQGCWAIMIRGSGSVVSRTAAISRHVMCGGVWGQRRRAPVAEDRRRVAAMPTTAGRLAAARPRCGLNPKQLLDRVRHLYSVGVSRGARQHAEAGSPPYPPEDRHAILEQTRRAVRQQARFAAGTTAGRTAGLYARRSRERRRDAGRPEVFGRSHQRITSF